MKKVTHIVFAALRIAIAVGVLIYLVLSGAISWSALRGLVQVWPLTLSAFVLIMGNIALTAWRLCVLMKPRRFHLSFSASLRLTLMGNFFNSCLPGSTSGDVVKIYYITEGNRGRNTELTTIILLDRAAGMFALVITPLIAATLFPGVVASSSVLQGLLCVAAIVAALMVFGIVASTSDRVRENVVVDRLLRTLPWGRYVDKVFDTLQGYRSSNKTLLAAVMISLLSHSLALGAILFVAEATSPNGFAWQMTLLAPLGFLANTLPLTPGGLGVGETAFDALFAIGGIAGGAQVLLGWRLLFMMPGLLGLGFYLQGRRHLVHATHPPLEVAEELSFS